VSWSKFEARRSEQIAAKGVLRFLAVFSENACSAEISAAAAVPPNWPHFAEEAGRVVPACDTIGLIMFQLKHLLQMCKPSD
jgi:hypothetical protein